MQLMKMLKFFNFSQTRFLAEYFSSDKKQNEFDERFRSLGVHRSHLPQMEQKETVCLICLEPYGEGCERLQIECGHAFCEECWTANLRQRIVCEQSIDLKCMSSQCQQVQFHSFVEKIAQKHPEVQREMGIADNQYYHFQLFDAYRQILCKRYVKESKTLSWCPGADCIYCLLTTDTTIKQLKCLCGQEFCFRCRTEVHYPAPCDLVKRWLRDLSMAEANTKWIVINTKTCPFCSAFVERSIGCNFLKCTCGNAFCYVCSQPWEPIHSNHFKCSALDSNQEQQELQIKSQQRELLKKYHFHLNRFLNANGTMKKTKEYQQMMAQTLESAFTYLQQTYNDCQFLQEALNELQNFRQILKWY